MSTLENCKVKIAEITHLLNDESAMLSEGRLDGLEDVVSRKTSAMMALQSFLNQLNPNEDINLIRPQIINLQNRAKENGLILERVVTGVKSARERLRCLQYNDAKVGAYNRVGKKLFLSEDQIQSEKLI